MVIVSILLFQFSFFFFFFLFMAVPAANGSSQARGWNLTCICDLCCSNTRSFTHWSRPGINPSPHRDNIRSLIHWATMGTPFSNFQISSFTNISPHLPSPVTLKVWPDWASLYHSSSFCWFQAFLYILFILIVMQWLLLTSDPFPWLIQTLFFFIKNFFFFIGHPKAYGGPKPGIRSKPQ